jgi:LPXTG-motif cell wall-anchored protein
MPDTGATDNYGLLFFTAAAFLAGGWFMRRRTV